MTAQQFHGEYHLTGVPETGSGFRFNADGTFDFYLVYGAMDRVASGTFTVLADTIKLKSNKKPGQDFGVKGQRKKGDGLTIRVTDPNQILASNVQCLYWIDGEQHDAYTDEQGMIFIEQDPGGKLYVRHGLYIDIPTLLRDEGGTDNDFELTLKPSLQEVSFQGIDFFIKEDMITCLPNYFMPMENIRYVKS